MLLTNLVYRVGVNRKASIFLAESTKLTVIKPTEVHTTLSLRYLCNVKKAFQTKIFTSNIDAGMAYAEHISSTNFI